MEKFRVLSDLHMDINENFPFSVSDNSIFTVIAGDTSGTVCSISASCDNPYICVDIKGERKAIEFFGHVKSAKISYEQKSGNWIYDGNVVTSENSGIYISSGSANDFPKDEDNADKMAVTLNFSNFAEDWIRDNVKRGIIVAGNHLVYNHDGYSIEELKRRLGRAFPLESDISFLDDSIGVISKRVDGILFVGSTLYTDYMLPCGENVAFDEKSLIERNKWLAQPKMSGGGLNDFNFGYTEYCTYANRWLEPDGGKFRLTPNNYERFFHDTFGSIRRVVEENADSEVVVVTHHCPSPRCISSKYVDSALNASYVSNLEDFILSHKNIRCWICGHVHHRADFRIGDCLVVMNPLGYCKYGEYMANGDGTKAWSPDTFVNVKNWEIERNSVDLGEWDMAYENMERKRLEWAKKYAGLFF